jgi:hypothetical protein
MLGVLRLVGRSIWHARRFAATELIHWSVARTIRAAARRGGTGHRRRRTHAERKQQSDENYREKAHGHHLNLTEQDTQSGLYFSRMKYSKTISALGTPRYLAPLCWSSERHHLERREAEPQDGSGHCSLVRASIGFALRSIRLAENPDG